MNSPMGNKRAVLYAVIGIAVIEIPLVHLLVWQLSHLVAWAVTGISVLSIGWLVVAAVRDEAETELVDR